MSLEAKLRALITRIGTEFKAIRAVTGDKTALTTADKSTLVAAINELKAATSGAAGINDATTGTASTWSSQKTADQIAASISALVNGAPVALDTLKELADALSSNDTDIAAVVIALDNRLRVDAVQALTAGQKQQGRDNLDVYSRAEIGDIDRDFVADLNAALT